MKTRGFCGVCLSGLDDPLQSMEGGEILKMYILQGQSGWWCCDLKEDLAVVMIFMMDSRGLEDEVRM